MGETGRFSKVERENASQKTNPEGGTASHGTRAPHMGNSGTVG
jgi:hypothetical protein